MDQIITTPDKAQANVSFNTFREGDFFISHCTSLDLAAQGDSRDEAIQNFTEILQLFIADALERETLDTVLREQGWTSNKVGNTTAKPSQCSTVQGN